MFEIIGQAENEGQTIFKQMYATILMEVASFP